MKTCPNCGTFSNDNENFCKNCGTKLTDEIINQDVQQPQMQNNANNYQPKNSGTSGFAITSLVLGIVTWVFGWFTLAIPGILGIIFGALAMGQCKKNGKGGYGMAIAGLILSIIMVAIFFIIIIIAAATAASWIGAFNYYF